MFSRSNLQSLCLVAVGLALVGSPLGCCLEIVEGEALHSPSLGSATGTASGGASSKSGTTGTSAATSNGGGRPSGSGTSSPGSGSTGGSSAGTVAGGSTGSVSSSGGAGSSTGTATGAPPDFTLWVGGSGALEATTLSKGGSVAFDLTCPQALLDGFEALDGQGNLWAQAPSSQLYIWTPAQLLQSCATTMPAIGLAATISGPIAFDSQGSLWTASENIVEGYRSTDLHSSDATEPSWAVSGDCGALNLLCVALGLAFDSNGYLWVANSYSVLAFAPATLDQPLMDAGMSNPLPNTPADFTLTTPAALAWDGGTSGRFYGGYVYNDLAFDSAGNLWISVIDTQANPTTHEIVELTQAQLQNLDTDEDPTPAVTIHESAGQQEQQPPFLGWVALAFDADGNLWAGSPSSGGPNLFRFSPASIANGGLPDITLTVPGDPSVSLAFSPIPPGLPIQP